MQNVITPPPPATSTRSSALGSGSSAGGDAEGGKFSAVVGSPKELARMGVVGLSCMVCRLKMRYIPFVAPAHDHVSHTTDMDMEEWRKIRTQISYVCVERCSIR